MEDTYEHSENPPEMLSEDTHQVPDIHNEEKSKYVRRLSFETLELTSKTEIMKSKGDDKTIPCQSSSQKDIAIHLEPSLAEKLSKKIATADELEDRLQTLRFDFKGKLQSVDRVKQELNKQEANLIQSVQKIEGYMRQIYSLKREADHMFERLKSSSIQLALDFSILCQDYHCMHARKQAAITVLTHFRSAQSCLRSAICDLKEYSSVKKLVEYYLVLKLLKKDLLEEDKRRQREAQENTDEQRSIGHNARNLPLFIRTKEETLYKITSEIKEMRSKNIELEKQVSNFVSASAKEDMMWDNINRWINKTHRSICEVIPSDSSEPKDSIMDQLQKLQDFVVLGNKIIDRLHK